MSNIEKALAEIALAANTGPCEVHTGKHGQGDKGFLINELETYAQKADPGVRRGMHMLLSLTLELWRRNEYMFEALKQNLDSSAFLQADPAFAARVELHNRALLAFEVEEPGATDWEKRAVLADEIVHRMLDVTEKPHRELLALAVARIGPEGVAAVTAVETARVFSLDAGRKREEKPDHDHHPPAPAPAPAPAPVPA